MKNRLAVKILYYLMVAGIAVGTALGIYFGFVRTPELPPQQQTPNAAATQNETGQPGGTSNPDGVTQPDSKGSLEVRRPEITHIVDGKVQWQVKADEVETNTETGASVFRSVEGQVFGDEERVLHFVAPLTFYDPASDTVRIQGEFQGQVGADDGAALQGKNLHWNNLDRKLMVEDARLSMAGTRIQGDAMTILPEEDSVLFQGNVQIELELAPSRAR